MRASLKSLLQVAMKDGYALGAFNVYNLEGVKAVVEAAELERSPVIVQIHPKALAQGGGLLTSLCIAAAEQTTVPICVHLDHCDSPQVIRTALRDGLKSIMVDGSTLDFQENLAFTRTMIAEAHREDAAVEAELGRLSGSEDGVAVDKIEARMTDPEQAARFVAQTNVDALAICIGNVHGHYQGEVKLDFERLAAIRKLVSIPLVLHGASGVPERLIRQAIELGVCKFNVNTEVREAYLAALRDRFLVEDRVELLDLMQSSVKAMREVAIAKLHLFGSAGKA